MWSGSTTCWATTSPAVFKIAQLASWDSLNNRRVAGAEQRVLHLLDDTGQARLDDLQGYGIDEDIRSRSQIHG